MKYLEVVALFDMLIDNDMPYESKISEVWKCDVLLGQKEAAAPNTKIRLKDFVNLYIDYLKISYYEQIGDKTNYDKAVEQFGLQLKMCFFVDHKLFRPLIKKIRAGERY